MSLQLAYKDLQVYAASKKLVYACYEVTANIPSEEKNNLFQQIRTGSLTVYINVVEGAFLKSSKKKRKCFKTAQGSLIVLDATIDILIELNYTAKEKISEIENLIAECYQLLNELLKK